jgi:hypothetical protein
MGMISPLDGTVSLSAESVIGHLRCFEKGTCDNSSASGRVSNADLLNCQPSTHDVRAGVQRSFMDNSMLRLGTGADQSALSGALHFGEMESDVDFLTSAAFEY